MKSWNYYYSLDIGVVESSCLLFLAFFSITDRGWLHTADFLDREERSSYDFTVVASDGMLTTSVSVSVSVLDQNDNPPVFNENSAVYTIWEGQPNDRVLQVCQCQPILYRVFFCSCSCLCYALAELISCVLLYG